MSVLSAFQRENRIVFETGQPGFEHGVEQTVLSGPGLQLLDPRPRDSYQHRLHDVDGSVSELYQVNARWRACDLADAPTEEEQRQLRSWFLESGRTYPEVEDPAATRGQIALDSVPPPLGPALRALADVGAESGLMYASDVVVVLDGHSWLLPPATRHLVRMRRFGDDRDSRLRAAVPAAQLTAFRESRAIVSITTVPWRIEIMQGARGFRVALQQSGLLLAAAMQTFARAGADPTVATEFADIDVDLALDQDGVERFTTALIALSLRPPQARTPDPAHHEDGR